MMPEFTTGQEYDVKINSSSGHRSKLEFAVRRVRVIGSVEGGRLPFVDMSDGNKEKAVYLTNIMEVDGVPTGNRPARDDGPALRKGDYVLVDRAVPKDGTTAATVAEVVDRCLFLVTVGYLQPPPGKMLRNIPCTQCFRPFATVLKHRATYDHQTMQRNGHTLCVPGENSNTHTYTHIVGPLPKAKST
eukprot:COSAG01_NODE_5281_length_4359_cov_1.386620_2_plen_188_part_00